MKTTFRKKFLKELKIPQNSRIDIEKFVFEEAPQLKIIQSSKKIEKMKNIYKAGVILALLWFMLSCSGDTPYEPENMI